MPIVKMLSFTFSGALKTIKSNSSLFFCSHCVHIAHIVSRALKLRLRFLQSFATQIYLFTLSCHTIQGETRSELES